MMATLNSEGGHSTATLVLILLLTALLPGRSSSAQSAHVATHEEPSVRYRRLFDEAGARFAQDTNHVDIAWQFARACFDWADLATHNEQRAAIAQQGIAASRRATALDPKSAPAFYYLGLNLGQLAQTRRLSGLKLLDEMQAAFMRSLELDPHFDFAGAHRSIGMLYRDAPGWPASLGDRSKARLHLRQAVELAPAYPENQLSLLEAHLNWGDKKFVISRLEFVTDILRKARLDLTGPEWELSWKDWEHRWEKLKASAKVATARSPQQQP